MPVRSAHFRAHSDTLLTLVFRARCDEFRDQQDVPLDKRPKPYILDAAIATWDEMAGHCERVHPKAYEGLINMTPDQMRVKEQQFGLCGRASRK